MCTVCLELKIKYSIFFFFYAGGFAEYHFALYESKKKTVINRTFLVACIYRY